MTGTARVCVYEGVAGCGPRCMVLEEAWIQGGGEKKVGGRSPPMSIAVKNAVRERLKSVKGPNIYIPPLTRKPEQQRFTIRSGILTSISSRQHSAISGSPLPEPTDFGSAVCSWTDPSICGGVIAPNSVTLHIVIS